MAPFYRNHKDVWHRKLASSGAYQCLVGDDSTGFPFGSLRAATDEYVTKKKLHTIPEAIRELKLVGLITDHVDKEGGAREIALLACIHLLTSSMSAAILVSFRQECQVAESNPRYLQCLMLCHYACPDLVKAQECRIAEALMQTLICTDLFASVKSLFKVMGLATTPCFLPVSYINHILDTTHFDTFFQSHVPPAALALAIINAQIPPWRRWHGWKPNYLRLMKWEGGKFTETQREQLVHIFELEGPDTTGQGRGTLRESVPGCFRHINVLSNDPLVLDRLISVLDQAQGIGSVGVDLFIYLCIESPGAVDTNLLDLTEGILNTANTACIEGMLYWLKSLEPDTGFNDRMVALTKALPVFDLAPDLRKLVGGDWSTDVTEVMRTAQMEYCIQLERGVADNFGRKIHSFGRAILAARWIQDSLTPEFLRNLQRFPCDETLAAIFSQLEAPEESADTIRKYLAGTLGGKDDVDTDDILSQIQSEMKYCRSGMDADRKRVSVTVRGLRYLNSILVSVCHDRILMEDDLFLRDLLPIIRHDTTLACVNLARLLGRRRNVGSRFIRAGSSYYSA